MQKKSIALRLIICCCILLMGVGVFAQTKKTKNSKGKDKTNVQASTTNNTTKPVADSVTHKPAVDNAKPKPATDSIKHKAASDSIKNKPTAGNAKINTVYDTVKPRPHKKLVLADTLTTSDYMLGIERVNDNLIAIADSAKLSFEVVGWERRINSIANEIVQIRQNLRDKHAAINLKNLYLYQSFASNLNEDNEQVQASLGKAYSRIYHAKLHLKTVLNDTMFKKVYDDSTLRSIFDQKLTRLERKWERTDTLTKTNIDSLNVLKVKLADNAINLSNMLSGIDTRLDKGRQQIFHQEVNYLWQKDKSFNNITDSTKTAVYKLRSEQKAIDYYFGQTSGERAVIIVFGLLLFIWLFFRRKLIRALKAKKEEYDFLHLHYMNNNPILSLVVLLLCLTPFFDAYAPTSYIAIEYIVLLAASSIIIFKNKSYSRVSWLIFVVLFIANALACLLMEPTLQSRLWLLAMHLGIIVFSLLFYRKLNKQIPYSKWIKIALLTGILLSCLGILLNIFGRFSLACIFGLAGIFAVTQAVVLPIFADTFVEIFLVQLKSSRLKKGVNKPFDCSFVVNKIKGTLVMVAGLLWLIMLASNLNIYHNISSWVSDTLSANRSIGSISFRLNSILFFFIIIWIAHILQQLISFLFGETGIEAEEITSATKGQHSRLLITRLLVLIGGYLLAIAASGLPIDKLTFLLGALGVGIGMGLQSVVNNFVSGIILIFDGSLKIGDEIEIGGQAGKVKEIGLRASTITTGDGAEVIIPNGSILSQNIINWTFSNDEKRVMLQFVLYGKELDSNIINEVINTTIKSIPNVIPKKAPAIVYTKVTQDTCSLTVKFWSMISKTESVKSEALLKLNAAFTNKNIEFV